MKYEMYKLYLWKLAYFKRKLEMLKIKPCECFKTLVLPRWLCANVHVYVSWFKFVFNQFDNLFSFVSDCGNEYKW